MESDSKNNETTRNKQVPSGLLEPIVRQILSARVYDVAVETPLNEAPLLSTRQCNRVLLKREDVQPVFSFKCRGAYNKIANLPDETLQCGIITASAGNHAQGVALAANRLGIRAVIVMPQTTPSIKVQAVQAYGVEVVLHGDTFELARAHALKLMQEQALTYIPPYDDEAVIAGQGTVAMEVLRQCTGRIDAVFVPCGGGGLIAGMAAYIKYVRPDIRVIGVEPQDAACLSAALLAGERVILPEVGLFAEGVAVAQIGEIPFQYAQHTVDEVITVTEDELCAGVKDIFEDTRAISEPSGALALAGLKQYVDREKCTGRNFVAVVSGANTNFDRLRYISERTQFGEHREALFAATIPEQPGSFLAFCEMLGKRSITEFNYRFADEHTAHVFVGLALSDTRRELPPLLKNLTEKGYPVTDFSDDELTKLHIRHMVGGHALRVSHELIYRFIFPERPGALLTFLQRLSDRWNISLFHYRNHGAAFGRVLVGFQASDNEKTVLNAVLDSLGYHYVEESNNEAYRLFLGA
ncbi:MAG: threonine ammonia-lyase, biosynthetic [Gammaproteobacteria bacterium]